MGLDIRLPIGCLFLILGALLASCGLYAAFRGDETYLRKSLGINIDLWWGLCLLAFGGVMAWFGRRAHSREPSPPAPPALPPARPPAP